MTINKNRKGLTIAIALTVLTLIQSCEQAPEQPKYQSLDYNVILISIDTLGADYLGVYGQTAETSPNVDKFTVDSVMFETAIAQAPSTLPSHASIFTGMIPVNHGAFAAMQTPIATELPTLPEIMQDAGYQTISFNGGGLVASIYGFGRGFDAYNTDRKNDRFQDKVDAAINWLDDHSDEKFFMFLHTYEVHGPYSPAPHYLSMFDSDYTGDLPDEIDSKLLSKINTGKTAISSDDLEHIKNTYRAEIRSMDNAFGQLIAYLRDKGLYDDTIIIFTSDHGEEFGEHGGVGRHFYTLYDELLHVPFIVKLPGSKLAGTVVEDQVRGLDILPTLLDLLVIDMEASFDGTSLVPLMLGEDVEKLIAVSQQDTSDALPPTSIRSAGRKLIVRPPMLEDLVEPYRWFEKSVDFRSSITTLTIPMASVVPGHPVRVLVDGNNVLTVKLSTKRKNYFAIINFGGQQIDAIEENDRLDQSGGEPSARHVIIESLAPCVNAEEVGLDKSLGCVSFRIFDPQELYLLDQDPAEQHNVYADPAYREEANQLRGWLAEQLVNKPDMSSERLDLDEETRRQLKSLGYLN